jgi:WD40 repeat protein
LALAYTPDGKHLISGAEDGTVRLWDVATGKEVARLDHEEVVKKLALTPDGKSLAVGCGWVNRQRQISLSWDQELPGFVRVWDLTTLQERATWSEPGGISALAISADGKTVVTGNYYTGVITVRDVASPELGWEVPSQRDVRAVSLANEDQILVTCTNDDRGQAGHVRFWNMRTRSELWVPRAWFEVTDGMPESAVPWGPITAVEYSPANAYLAVGTCTGGLHVWDLKQTLGLVRGERK